MKSIDVVQAHRLCQSGRGLLLDVRGPAAWAETGVPEGAQAVLAADVVAQANAHLQRGAVLMLLCHRGISSVQLAAQLIAQGLQAVCSVTGGFQAWQQSGLPVHKITDPDRLAWARYDRQMRLPDLGAHGQRLLASACVALVGAGGLGSPAALYLAAAGVGHLKIIDDDRVELSNLHRQVIHSEQGLGQNKAESARESLQALNADVRVDALPVRLTPDNARELLRGVDVVLDGSDRLATRLALNDACVSFRVPLIFAAVHRFEIQLSLFDFKATVAPCYRCLFSVNEGIEPPNCSESGVLGVVPGLAGLLQATECIKWITGLGRPLASELLLYDVLSHTHKVVKYRPSQHCNHGQNT